MNYGVDVPEHTKPTAGLKLSYVPAKATAVSARINQGFFLYH